MMPGPVFEFGSRRWPAYGVFVCSGLIAGTVLAMVLLHLTARSPITGLILMLPAIAVCACLALATKVVTGQERLVFYHHLLAGVATCMFIVWWMGEPQLPHLDVIACVGATVSGFGRIGCLLAGCCHGRPHRMGVRYSQAHVCDGFPAQYAGVPLVPVQAFESAWAFAIAAVCCTALISGAPAGRTLATFALMQGAGRFLLEFLRGDARRPQLAGLTEAQWTAALMVLAASFIAWPQWLPALLAALVVAAVVSRRESAGLSAPGHLFEALEAAARARWLDRPEWPQSTSRGLRITAGRVGPVDHYTLSSSTQPLTSRFAERLAALIPHSSGREVPRQIVSGPNGMFHIVLGGH